MSITFGFLPTVSNIDELLAKLGALSPAEKAALVKETVKATEDLRWIPNPGPQTEAYFCPADELLYGGQAGGGKSNLVLGLALTAHERTLIMRREYGHLNALTEEACKMYGTRDGFNAAPPPRLRFKRKDLPSSGLIEFGAAQLPGSEDTWQGQAHDLLAFDEAVQFLESQVLFLKTWNRPSTPGQRCRLVMASNPPVRSEGQWIIKMFRPWLDITYGSPAKSGELRWYVRTPDGDEIETDGPEPRTWGGVTYRPKSRTFIHAAVSDNPFLVNTNYQAELDALPEPYRSAFRDGNFMASKQDDPDQLIPSEWIRSAQQRWTSQPPKGIPMCSIGVDVAQGGPDNTVLAIRYDGWFAPIIKVPGRQTPGGHEVAGLVFSYIKDNATVVVDCGGGHGGAALEHLRTNGIEAVAYKGVMKTVRRSKDKQFGFHSVRDEAYFRLREALDPSQPGGSPIMLPDDPELFADLTVLHFDWDARGYFLKEEKQDMHDLLNRSPDKGDAVAMAWYAGYKGLGAPSDWAKRITNKGWNMQHPRVIMKTRK